MRTWQHSTSKSIRISKGLGIRFGYRSESFDYLYLTYYIYKNGNNVGELTHNVHRGMMCVYLDGKDKMGFDTRNGAFCYIRDNA